MTSPAGPAAARPMRGQSLGAVAFGAALVLFLSHATLLRLPFFWDELGQFIPAARDLYQHGLLVPRSTVPNAHPPVLMAYLAAVWLVTGYSIAATRVAMLVVAWVGVVATFLLSRELSGRASGATPLLAVAFLLASPLFFTQSMMAQLDMPAMTLAIIALVLFLRDKTRWAAVVCAVAVLVKETSVAVPLALGGWLWFEKRRREALWFAAGLLPLVAWFGVLHAATGYAFGNREFTQYNLVFPTRPGQVAMIAARRFSYLFFENFHWICTLAIGFALARRRLQVNRAWKVCALVFVAQTGVVTVLGGAGLERYLMPVLPILYVLTADSLQNLLPARRAAAALLLIAGLLSGLFIGPPLWPYPHENNLAMVDLVRLHQQAARFVEANCAGLRIVTAWPLSAALRRPEMGYVDRKLDATGITDFSSLVAVRAARPDVFILYSRDANPPVNLLENRAVRFLYRQFFEYRPPMPRDAPQLELGMQLIARFSRGRQWLEIYAAQRRDRRHAKMIASS